MLFTLAGFVLGVLCGAAGVKGLTVRAKALPKTVAELRAAASQTKKVL